MPAKGTVTVLAAMAVMIVSLGGCAFWPTRPGNLPVKQGQTEVQYCTAKATAKECAEKTRNAIAGSKTNAFHVQLASSYVLLALGTATGAAIAFDGARGLVKWLALSAAAVLGLDSVVRPGTQRTIYSTAERRITCEIAKYEALDALSGDDRKKSFDQLGDLTNLRTIRNTALENSVEFVEGASLVARQADKRGAPIDAQAEALINAAVADAASNEQNVAQLADDIIGLVEGRHASLGLATLRIRSSVIDDIAANLPSGEALLKDQEAKVLAQMQRLGVGGAAQKLAAQDTKGGSQRDNLNNLIANYRAVLESPECSPSTS